MNAPEPMSSAPAPRWSMVANAGSKSRSLPVSRMMSCCPIAFAAASTSLRSASVSGPYGRTSMAIVVALGTSSRNISNRFPPNSPAKKTTPVTLPPGRLRRATRPSRTGSLPVAKTIGTVAVAALAASAEVWFPTITATGRRINSAVSAGNRSGRLSAERNSIATLWPSTKPVSLRPRRNAATMCAASTSGELRMKPITGIAPCWARAASGHAATAPRSGMNSRRRIKFAIVGFSSRAGDGRATSRRIDAES